MVAELADFGNALNRNGLKRWLFFKTLMLLHRCCYSEARGLSADGVSFLIATIWDGAAPFMRVA
jgi:hypothetical protein